MRKTLLIGLLSVLVFNGCDFNRKNYGHGIRYSHSDILERIDYHAETMNHWFDELNGKIEALKNPSVGVGVQLRIRNAEIVHTTEHAKKAGIEAEDRVLAVDGKSVRTGSEVHMLTTTTDVSKTGTKVRILVEKKNGDEITYIVERILLKKGLPEEAERLGEKLKDFKKMILQWGMMRQVIVETFKSDTVFMEDGPIYQTLVIRTQETQNFYTDLFVEVQNMEARAVNEDGAY